MSACGCRVEVSNHPHDPANISGRAQRHSVVHCPRHAEAHVARLEAQVQGLKAALGRSTRAFHEFQHGTGMALAACESPICKLNIESIGLATARGGEGQDAV